MNRPLEPFLHELRHDLTQPLPGPSAQFGMAPHPRRGAELDDPPRPDARASAVLILFYPRDGALHLPLILRPTYRGVHSGQVSLPGGAREADDLDLAATARRETFEEIGVEPDAITLLGQLSALYVSASNHIVYPFVGWIGYRPEFRADPFEVAALIEAPLSAFQDPQNRHTEVWQLRDRTALVPFFRIDGQIIWGATAMMMSELLELPSVRRRQNGASAASPTEG